MPNSEPPLRDQISPSEAADLVAARYRLSANNARLLVRDGLISGQIHAVMTNGGGAQRPVALSDIDDAALDNALPLSSSTPSAPEIGLSAVADPNAGFAITFISAPCWIDTVSRLDAERYAEALIGQAPENSTAAAPRRKVGRPVEYDWDRAYGQVLLRVYEYGMPQSTAEIAAELLDWFGKTTGRVPDESTVRRWIDRFWPAGSCELDPRK